MIGWLGSFRVATIGFWISLGKEISFTTRSLVCCSFPAGVGELGSI